MIPTAEARLRERLHSLGAARADLRKQTAKVDEAVVVAVDQAAGLVPLTDVARLLGVDRSTVYRMLGRNRSRDDLAAISRRR